MGNRQNLTHSQLTENKPKNKTEHLQKKVISHFYRKKFARPSGFTEQHKSFTATANLCPSIC
jgi:hypothetical protein